MFLQWSIKNIPIWCETVHHFFITDSPSVFHICISVNVLDYFIVGVTNMSSAVQAPVRGTYPLCGTYPNTATAGVRMIQYCSATTPPGKHVIIQQPANGPGSMSICELEIYGIVYAYPHVTFFTNFNHLESAYRHRPHHSTETSPSQTFDDIFCSIDRSQPTSLVSLDLNAAFNTIDHSILTTLN